MKKKMNLSDLKVKSFVVNLESEEVNTLKGGNTRLGHDCVRPTGFGIDCGNETVSRFECDQHAI